jgi:hypothetical protein
MTQIFHLRKLLKKFMILFFFFIGGNLYATDQALDVLIINDTTWYIYSSDLYSDLHPILGYPLETYIYRVDKDSSQNEAVDDMLKCYRWCVRGYIAKWEIINDSLFLKEISYFPTVTAYMESEPSDTFPLNRLFPKKDTGNGVFAEWYAGLIRTVIYNSTYPSYDDEKWKGKRQTLYIKNGILAGKRKT